MYHAVLAVGLVAAAAPMAALAQLSSLRGTIPGTLHQCEETNLFFYQSGGDRPLTVLLLNSDSVPDSLRTNTTTLSEAIQHDPLQVIQGITTPDDQQYNFQLQLAEGAVFEVFAFYQDTGDGKALNLTRTVTTALPSATSCLTNVQTTVAGVIAAATSSSGSGGSTITSRSSLTGTGATSTSTATSAPNGLSNSPIPTSTGSASSNKLHLVGLSIGFVGVLATLAFA